MRYYHSSNLFGEGYFGVGKKKEETFGGSSVSSENVLGWSVGVGYALFLNDNLGLEPVVKYGSIKNTNDTASGLFDKTTNISVVVGLLYYINR